MLGRKDRHTCCYVFTNKGLFSKTRNVTAVYFEMVCFNPDKFVKTSL